MVLAKKVINEGRLANAFHYRAKLAQGIAISTGVPHGGRGPDVWAGTVVGGITRDHLVHRIGTTTGPWNELAPAFPHSRLGALGIEPVTRCRMVHALCAPLAGTEVHFWHDVTGDGRYQAVFLPMFPPMSLVGIVPDVGGCLKTEEA